MEQQSTTHHIKRTPDILNNTTRKYFKSRIKKSPLNCNTAASQTSRPASEGHTGTHPSIQHSIHGTQEHPNTQQSHGTVV
ncbi:hypothetical protein E2C01_077769 [Portunus trituberculatus]|uniref:Uncharacterized protein n=1 Tax=Portunus trituberculatus TaxID=210409 RepID=A0A5B7IM72_PORTR|nr:hypothetical protein [Portunus trituberculatus]